MMEGIASMHSWIKAQTMIRSVISYMCKWNLWTNSIKNDSKLKKSQNCCNNYSARPTKLGKKGELGGEEEDEEEDITILLTSRWVEDIILSYKNFFENALMGVGAFQN